MEKSPLRARAKIGHGAETSAYRLLREKSKNPRNLVLKTFEREVFGQRLRAEQPESTWGLDEGQREKMGEQLKNMREVFGSAIPPYRFVENPDAVDRYYLLQYFVEAPKDASGEVMTVNDREMNTFDYHPSDLMENPQAQKKTRELAEALRTQYERYLAGDTEALILDLSYDGNILTDANHNPCVIDVGLQSQFFGDMHTQYRTQIARLWLIGGGSMKELQNDPFYEDVRSQLDDAVSDWDNADDVYGILSTLYPITSADIED